MTGQSSTDGKFSLVSQPYKAFLLIVLDASPGKMSYRKDRGGQMPGFMPWPKWQQSASAPLFQNGT